MQTIKSILKGSIEQLGLVEKLTLEYALVSLSAALFCAIVIYCVYKYFYRGAVYSENFSLLLVMMTVTTAFVILTISSNLVLSLGMVGALSIVRFRSAVKDPLDVGFMFWGIAAGITTGAGLYPFAIVCTLFISLVYIAFFQIGSRRTTYVVVIRHSDDATEAVRILLSDLKIKLRGQTKYRGEVELTIDIRCPKGDIQFMDALLEIPGVTSAVLVECTGD